MKTSRREFLRWTTGGAAWWLAGRRLAAEVAAGEAREPNDAFADALAVHRATRNTRLGAIGTRLSEAGETLRPWKPYHGLPRHSLPKPEWHGGRGLFAVARAWAPTSFAEGPLSLAELSRLLFLTNGVTGDELGTVLRSAPSAGALYAGEVYVVAERIEDLAPGVYYYAVGRHRLVRLREGSFLGDVSAALDLPSQSAGAAAAVLLTNVFARYRVRYANRGYRYALIDSGHIGENLRLAAAELGLAARAPLRWQDDRLNALLQVDGREEAVCAVHLVGRRREAAPLEAAAPPFPLVERGMQGVEGIGAASRVEAYHEATKLVRAVAARASVPVKPGGATPSRRSEASDVGDATAGETAAERGAPDTAVHDTIRVRRSTREFHPAAMTRDALLRVCELARGLPALEGTPGLELHVIANRIEGLSAGLYRYDPAARRLDPRREGELAEALVEAALGQPRTGQAGAALIGVARLAEAAAREGARSYRHLLLEAGATAQRIYLAAEAQRLTARNLAAFYDDQLDELLELDGEREVAVHLTAVGVGD